MSARTFHRGRQRQLGKTQTALSQTCDGVFLRDELDLILTPILSEPNTSSKTVDELGEANHKLLIVSSL